jgi:hypothetical protein
MNSLAIVLRLIHIVSGVYWAGTVFFFSTFLEPSLRSLGPDGGKVMTRMVERGYLKVMPAVSIATLLSGVWLLWILSDGFNPGYMSSPIGISFSTGGVLAILAWIVGMAYLRPAAMRLGAIGQSMILETSETGRAALMAEMGRFRARTLLGSRIVFALLVGAVALMAVARYL